VIEMVEAGSPAEAAGLKADDQVLALDGRDEVDEIELRAVLEASIGRSVGLRIARGGATLELTVVPQDRDGKGRIGVLFRQAGGERIPLGPIEAARESVRENLRLSTTLFVTLRGMVTGRLPMKTLSGPVEIAQVARRAVWSGFDGFLFFLGFISLQLGVLNLLPVPVLDGGHILVLGLESLMRRDFSDRVKERVMQAGLVFLLLVFCVVMYHDLSRLFVRLF
jgi:regulator of sigma E protease